ncbi:NSFL1 cofactor p47-like protein [Euroglyphus maynei]|uniref:NSFL1 cofactor p47-like protein n=1 Tax=Euroglyphus maynei TaxID=6958 RepID=A0A1Y3B7E2_EURMA|nr:NSFL1 cofactor p47-like protein [Euroglyphus maynei]
MELSGAEQEKICESFINLTGVDQQQAKFFLESTNYNFELAVQQFYENSEDIIPPLDSSTSQQDIETIDITSEMSDDDSNSNKPAPKPNPSGNSNIATLSSIRDDSDPGGQAFYAGGSEHSGQQVLGPQKSSRDPNNIVSEMFKQAREHAISEEELNASKKPNKPAFTGIGATLGSTTETSRQIFGGSSSSRQFSSAAHHSDDSDDSNRDTTLKLWRDGFSIDDGPLRSYQDPSNAEFLASIRSGQIPRELSSGGRSEVHLKMEDHRTEEYEEPPKKPAKPFTGEGQRLGTPASEIISHASQFATSDPATREQALESANAFLRFDSSQPHTRVQIRLADGTRLVPQINTDHLISDLRQYICLARPEYGASQFVLMTTFPNKVIEDESVTIKDAGLSNSSIVQRIKND